MSSFFFPPLSRTVEPGGQVLALHAVVLKAQVPQNDWLRTQEVVERCRVQLLICRDKICELRFNSGFVLFFWPRSSSLSLSLSLGAHNERSVVHSEEETLKIRNKREGKRKKTKRLREWAPEGSAELRMQS